MFGVAMVLAYCCCCKPSSKVSPWDDGSKVGRCCTASCAVSCLTCPVTGSGHCRYQHLIPPLNACLFFQMENGTRPFYQSPGMPGGPGGPAKPGPLITLSASVPSAFPPFVSNPRPVGAPPYDRLVLVSSRVHEPFTVSDAHVPGKLARVGLQRL